MSQPDGAPERDQFYKCFTKTTFLNFEDSLDIGKIRLFMGKFQRGSGMSEGIYHFFDVDTLRPVLMDLSWGKGVEEIDYKGGTGKDGKVISRVGSIKTGDNDTVWIEIKHGPGKKSETGAVMPAGKSTAAVAIGLKTKDARRMALAVLAYIAAQEAARAVSVMMGTKPIEKPASRIPERQTQAAQAASATSTSTTAKAGVTPELLISEGIVADKEQAQYLMDLLGIVDGDPVEISLARIKLFNRWRKDPECSSNTHESRSKAAARAILGEVPEEVLV